MRSLVALPLALAVVASLPAVAHAAQHARYGVGVRVLDLVDDSRATPADPEAPRQPVVASDARALPTTVLYPTIAAASDDPSAEAVPDAPPARGRFPVILFSHGAPGSPRDYRLLLQHWVARGYVVVAPQYPVTSIAGPTDVAWSDQRDQVRDARFVLSQVLRANRVPWDDGGLGRRLDPAHIGAAGHSMGGATTLALVSDCCRDPRIDAALVLAGISEPEAGPRLRHPTGPILFAHATLDMAVPFRNSTRAYRQATSPKYLLEIDVPIAGIAAHILPFTPGRGRLVGGIIRTLDAFLAAYLRDDEAAARRLTPRALGSDDLELRRDP